MGDDVDAGMGEHAGNTSAPRPRKVVTASERIAIRRRSLGVPDSFICPSVFWKKDEATQRHQQYAFGPGQLAKEWRDYTKMKPTMVSLTDASMLDKANKVARPPALFGTGLASSLKPLDTVLVPLPRDKKEPAPPKPAPLTASEKAADQINALRRQLMVRVARKQLNFCQGYEIAPPDAEQMGFINTEIARLFSKSLAASPPSLTSDEVECWAFHEVALTGHTRNLYDAEGSMPAYQKATNDVLDILDYSSERFCADTLGEEEEPMIQLDMIRQIVVGGVGPIEQGDMVAGANGEQRFVRSANGAMWREMLSLPLLSDHFPLKSGSDSNSTVTIMAPDGTTQVELSEQGTRLAMLVWTDLAAFANYLNSTVGQRDETMKRRRGSKASSSTSTHIPAAVKSVDVGKTVSIVGDTLKIAGEERAVDWTGVAHNDLNETIITKVKGSWLGAVMCANGFFLNPAMVLDEEVEDDQAPKSKKKVC